MAYDIHYVFVEAAAKADWATWTAIFISILALAATWWQAHLSRVHNKLSVRPQLEGHAYWEGDIYSLEVRNDGLGPAIITEARVFYRDTLVEGSGIWLIDNAFSRIPGCRLIDREFFHPPFVLPSGKSIQIFKVSHSHGTKNIEEYLGGLLRLQIDYESAYKEKCPMYETRRSPLPDIQS